MVQVVDRGEDIFMTLLRNVKWKPLTESIPLCMEKPTTLRTRQQSNLNKL